ncbi:hypothetical protein GQ53DRAFT_184400 [Thozetella sp. PMI_491]|nr:hypothetical protein GQ53DRAFT_184400 [Thozetella sp. PMI_491]
MRNRAARLASSRFCTAVVSSDVLFPRKRCSGEVFELPLDEAVLDSLDGPGEFLFALERGANCRLPVRLRAPTVRP